MVFGMSLATYTRLHVISSLVGIGSGLINVVTLIALYLNVFVLVIQGFLKVPALKALAPAPLFAIVQLVVMILFIVLGFLAVKKFHPEQLRAARPA